jgi:hypothetical protein
MGLEPDPFGLIKIYDGLIDYLIIDKSDYNEKEKRIKDVKIIPANITINNDEDVIRLYKKILEL